MEIKTYRANSLQEALQLVRNELGPDASVVHTRELKQSRMGLFRKTVVEVSASAEVPVASRFPAQQTSAQHGSASAQTRAGLPAQAAAQSLGQPTNRSPEPPGMPLATSQLSSPGEQGRAAPGQLDSPRSLQRDSWGNMAADGRALHSTGAQPSPTQYEIHPQADSLSPEALELLSEMLERGIPPHSATRLVRDVCEIVPIHQQSDPWLLKGQASQLVAKRVNVSGSIEVGENEPRVVALVGPTGVGKTTTLAKIAAGFRFDLGLEVGMITIDTFRLGAVDQLLQYAELISAPLEVVNSPDQITGALQRLRECDLVLIDTAGRSPRDAEQLAVLADFLKAAQPDSTHLVVSTASSVASARDAISRFGAVSPSNLILTKIDESVQLGSWFDLLGDCSLPVSYITTGQHVPEDISVASRRRLASLLLGNSQHQEQMA